MKFFYVYVLLQNNGQFYTGSTSGLERRYKEHQRGKVAATRNRRPVKLIYYEAYLSESDAKRRERYFKTAKGKRTLRLQIRDYWRDAGVDERDRLENG